MTGTREAREGDTRRPRPRSERRRTEHHGPALPVRPHHDRRVILKPSASYDTVTGAEQNLRAKKS